MRHSRVLRVLFWTAGSDHESIQIRSDVVRHSSIGTAVWLTTLVSSASAFIALQLAFSTSVVVAAVGALVWAMFIFNTDRMLVGGRTEWVDDHGVLHNSRWSQTGVWVFRISLSLLLAFSITEPLIVRLFNTEIASQLPIDKANAQKQFEASQAASSDDQARLDRLLEIYKNAHTTTQQAQDEVNKWSAAAQCENAGKIDCGPGVPPGTGVAGTNGDEYRRKQGLANTAQQALENAQKAENDAHTAYETANARVRDAVAARLASTSQVGTADGFFAQRQALENYIAAHPGVATVRWLLVALLVAVDMSAVLLKGLFRDGGHDRREIVKIYRGMNWAQQLALEESKENYAFARKRGSADHETAMWNVDGQAANQRKIDQARRDADLDVTLAEIEQDREARMARLAAQHRAGQASDSTGIPDGPTDKHPSRSGWLDGEPDHDSSWRIYDRRWQIIEPLRTPPLPNTPWVVADLREEYPDDLVLKPLSPDPSLPEEEAKARTRQAANQLSLKRGFVHRNVADILGAGYDQRNGAYLVHYRYDTDLSEYLNARRYDAHAQQPFRVRDALGFSMQLAEGMCAVWIRMQRLHLDIKPPNVGVEYGPQPALKLMDFGLTARLDGLSPSGNDSHTPRGTQFYAAPEQWAEARADDPDVARLSVAADLRGVAATIYRMFVGHAPGYAEAAARGYLDSKGNPSADPRKMEALFRMLETEPPLPMDRFVVGLPPGFVALIEQWLNVDPATRNPGPSVEDPQAYGEQVLSSLRYHVNEMLADSGLADRPVSSLRKAAYHRGGPAAEGAAAGDDNSTVDR